MAIIQSDGVDDKNERVRMLKGVELWGLTATGSSCKDSSISTKTLQAHETNDKRFHCGSAS
ncbi:hypothetical protein RJ639_039358 [Escallonia herrerae]|uniref:Uncharacterized protein n=1 Tax=Escallonia herrerae TaxID=1293975 RepID=A0AA89B828_9ASTE|nr:hypothetical protein RJ639_039358 [Escallonia herrerae]